jgi:hypothetical protein
MVTPGDEHYPSLLPASVMPKAGACFSLRYLPDLAATAS